MKFLLVFLVVLVLAWRWRTWREAERVKGDPAAPPGKASANMLACRLCGLHVPANEVVVGTLGNYCCTDHRLTLEP